MNQADDSVTWSMSTVGSGRDQDHPCKTPTLIRNPVAALRKVSSDHRGGSLAGKHTPRRTHQPQAWHEQDGRRQAGRGPQASGQRVDTSLLGDIERGAKKPGQRLDHDAEYEDGNHGRGSVIRGRKHRAHGTVGQGHDGEAEEY